MQTKACSIQRELIKENVNIFITEPTLYFHFLNNQELISQTIYTCIVGQKFEDIIVASRISREMSVSRCLEPKKHLHQ